MAGPYRRTIPVKVSSVEDARDVLRSLGLALKPRLTQRYAPRLQVDVAELFDSGKAAGDTTEPDVLLRQTVTLFRGWLEGATLSVEWSSSRPQEIAVVTEASSNLEDRATNAFGTSFAAVIGALGFLTMRFRLLAALAGIVVGAALGIGAYYVVGQPIIALLQGKHRRANELLALQLSAVAPEWLAGSPLVKAAEAASSPVVVRRTRQAPAETAGAAV